MAVRHLKSYASWVQTVEKLHHVVIHIVTFPQSESSEAYDIKKEEVTVIKYFRFKNVYVWKYIHYI